MKRLSGLNYTKIEIKNEKKLYFVENVITNKKESKITKKKH